MAVSSKWSSNEQELPPDRGVSRRILALGAGFCLLILLVSVGWWFLPDSPQETPFVEGPKTRPIAIASDGYVGSQKCQECHAHEYATWHDSFHRTMTQVASTASVVGEFDGVELERAGRRYRLGRDQENYWVEFEAPDSDPDKRRAKTIRQNVVLCTGSHHMQVYWLSTGRGRELADLPFVWLNAEQKWIPRESSFLLAPSSDGISTPSNWNGSCITCHTTHGDPNLKPPEPPQSTVAEFGIACEACHGPGEAHVRHHSIAPKSLPHDPIVHPLRLSHERSAEVCGQCHMAWHHQVAQSRLNYRPGDNLRSLRKTVVNPSQFWQDGMVRVVGREFNGLIESPCFQQGKMSCLSCHAMHQSKDDQRPRAEWTDDQLMPEMRGNEACLSCHEDYRSQAKLAAHTHHLISSQGSLCYNCHMPNTTYGLLKATRSHQVNSPSVAETLTVGRPNACNLCHLDKPLKWTDEKLVAWYGHTPTELPGEWSGTALSVTMALAGDAGQRALIAWHMGWEPAREASGDNWLAPYLAILMADDYPAVRFIAHRSLKQIGGYTDIPYHSEMPRVEQRRVSSEIMNRWGKQPTLFDKPPLLISQTGKLEMEMVSRVLKQRNQTIISLEE